MLFSSKFNATDFALLSRVMFVNGTYEDEGTKQQGGKESGGVKTRRNLL